MKQLTMIFAALLFALFATAQPPAPELLYHQTEPNPTFIKVSGITVDFADAEDYVFVYGSANRCYGATRLYSDPVFVAAMGNDDPSGVTGFAPGEHIQVGIYDAQSGRFYKLSGQAYNYISNAETTLIWQPLSVYTYEVTQSAGEVNLMIDKELAAVKLNIRAPASIKVKEGNQLFISIDEQNVKNVTLTKTGSGTLEKIRRWVTGQGWATYLYMLPENDETNIVFTATAQSAWDRSIVTATHQVAVDREYFKPGKIFFSNEYFNIVRDDGKLYLEAKTTHGIRISYTIAGQWGYKDLDKANVQPGDRILITSNDITGLYLQWARYKGVGTTRYKWSSPPEYFNKQIEIE